MHTMRAFAMGEANRGNEMMVFDWEKAARATLWPDRQRPAIQHHAKVARH